MSDSRGSGDLTRDILLRVRAQNLSTADFASVTASVNQLTAALDKQVEAASRGEVKERELAAQLTKLGQAAENLKGLSGTVEIFKNFETRLTATQSAVTKSAEAVSRYKAELSGADQITARQQTRLDQLTRTYEREAAALTKLQADQARYGESLEKAGIDTRNLVASEQQLREVADAIGAARTRLSKAQEDYAANVRKTTQALKEQQDAEKAAAIAAAQRAAADKAAAADEARMAADRAKAAREVSQGATGVNQTRYQRIREQIEEENRLRDQANRQAITQAQAAAQAQAEAQRRAGLGVMGRFREDLAERLRGYRQEQQAAQQSARAAATPIAGLPPGAARTDALGRPGRGGSAPLGILGLRPYELTNLGYQINDIVSGLASGQNALQVFAQQAGQVIQIFGVRFLSYLPQVAAGLAVVTVAVGSLARALQQAASNQEFLGFTQFRTGAIGLVNTQLTEVRKNIQDLGASWEEAGKVIREGIQINLVQDRFKQFGETAVNVARIMGISIPDAAKQIADAFHGSEQNILKLNDSLDFLRDADIRHIRTLFEAGKAEEARAFALDKLAAKSKEAADTMRTPWEKAMLDMGRAYRGLLDTIGNTEAFQALLKIINENIIAITKFIQELDKIKTKEDVFNWLLKNLLGGDYEALQRMRGVPESQIKPFTGIPGVTKPAGETATALIPGGPGDRVSTGGLKVDTPTLETLVKLLKEASAVLPPGYQVQAISTERPGATVRGTDTPSEHGAGRAIDVKIVDAQGRDVPGSMDVGGPLYTALDKAMLAAAAKAGVGPLAIGSTFRDRPDAGHYSLGGTEAERNAARRGALTSGPVTSGATTPEKTAADNALIVEREKLEILRAQSRERELALTKVQAEREARERGGTPEQQAEFVRLRLAEKTYEQTKKRMAEEDEDRKKQIDDARHLSEIEDARQKGRAAAIAAGITNYEDVRAAGEKAADVERDRLNTIDRENDAFKGQEKVIRDLQRGLDSKHASDLEKALEAVRLKYESIRETLIKTRDQSTKVTDKSRYETLLGQLPELQRKEEFDATQKAFEKQAQDALATRKDLIESYKKAEEGGTITVAEQQAKTKAAFELTNKAILEAVAGLEKWLATAKEMGATDLEIEKVRAKIAELRAETKYVDPLFKQLKETLQQSFGTHLNEAFNTIGQALGNLIAKTGTWKDVLTSVKSAFANFFAGLLKDIAGAIIKFEALKLLQSTGLVSDTGFLAKALGLGSQTGAAALGSGASTAAAGAEATAGSTAATAGFLFHTGGVVGTTSSIRNVPASWFAGAVRYHNGGMIGLAANEQAAILQRGEEVLAQNNPRHARNWGGGGGPDINIRNVLVADPDLVPAHMGSLRGEKVIMNVLTKNAATVRQLVR